MSFDDHDDALADAQQTEPASFDTEGAAETDPYARVLMAQQPEQPQEQGVVPLYKCADPMRLVVNSPGDGKYIAVDPNDHKVTMLPAALLTSEMITSEDAPFMLAGYEKDITREVGADKPTFTLPLGIGWGSGTRCNLIAIKGVHVEYHNPVNQTRQINVKGDKQAGLPYVNYGRMGLPTPIRQWMNGSLEQVGLSLGYGPKEHEDDPVVDPKTGQKSYANSISWTTYNVPKNTVPLVRVKGSGDNRPQKLQNVMNSLKKTVIGNAIFKVTAKRPEGFNDDSVRRVLGFNLIALDIYDVTDRQSPSPDTFKGFVSSDDNASNALVALLKGVQLSNAAKANSNASEARLNRARNAAANTAAAAASAAAAGSKGNIASGVRAL